jgi:mono/diheme cytochrome c family protein
VRATSLAAGGLACAGAAMTIAAFAGGGRSEEAPPATVATRAATGDRGAAVFAEQGCGSCHTFAPANARGGFGPDLALSLHGKSRDHVLESIVAPDAVVAYGWSPGTMPADFARRIDPEDLDPLVAYLMKGAAG